MKVFKTSALAPTIESLMDPVVFDDIQGFFDFYLTTIKENLIKNPENFDIHTKLHSSSGFKMEFILSKENYHLTLKQCEKYFVTTEEYEKAHECLLLIQKLYPTP